MSSAERGIRVAVGRAWWRFHAARLAECACLGLAACLVTLAAAVASGARPLTSAALLAAGLSALACGVAWWHEQRRTLAQVAHRLDAGLGREGALVTAFECAGRAERGALEELLLEREARDLVPASGRRAIAPPSVAFVAAPLIAAAVLSLALEHSPQPGTPGQVRGGGAGALAGGELAGGEPGADVAAETGGESDLVASGSSPLAAPAPAPTPANAESPAGSLAEAGGDAPNGDSAGSAASNGPLAGTELAAGTEVQPPESPAQGTSSGSALAHGDAGSTMAGSATGAGAAMSQTNESSSSTRTPLEGDAPEPGVVAGRWWPAHYDAIVRDWTAARGEEQQR